MQITVNTPLSEEDKDVLRFLLEDEAPKPAAKKAPAKKASAPKPEPEEEAGPTLDDAVEVATKLLDADKAKVVKSALVDVGVKRVSELEGDQIQEFLDLVEGA